MDQILPIPLDSIPPGSDYEAHYKFYPEFKEDTKGNPILNHGCKLESHSLMHILGSLEIS